MLPGAIIAVPQEAAEFHYLMLIFKPDILINHAPIQELAWDNGASIEQEAENQVIIAIQEEELLLKLESEYWKLDGVKKVIRAQRAPYGHGWLALTSSQ